jgi:3-oxoacyl-[acyl-carrier-protein] synthase-3
MLAFFVPSMGDFVPLTQALKSSAFRVIRDTEMMEQDLKRSKWFMSVFLRFMLSDGAGAWLLECKRTPA